MNHAFAPHERNFTDWRQSGYPGIGAGEDFMRHLDHDFPIPLWPHQKEAIQRCIYACEVLGWKDLLTNIVTGGGKTTIIGGVVAYMTQVHGIRQHLILVPNTIVRERILDAFQPTSSDFVYRGFPFFFGAHEDDPKRLAVHVMKVGEYSAGIRSANIIVGNIHQLYEGKDNWRVVAENCDQLCIYNDEAHNTRADQYNDLINKLKPKRFFRLDTTATPDRLDGLHPDSEMICEYGIRQAMHDNIIKRIVVFEPEIEKVTFTYYDWETQKEITADEVPWAEIEARKIPAVRYTMNPGPMGQQIGIALECLKHQRRTVPHGEDGKPLWKPLLFVVALNIEDAKNVTKALEEQSLNGDPIKVLLIHSESEDEAKEEAMSINKDMRNCKYDAIVSVMMLREGWDVKNISAILLFRKFSYKEVGNQKYSVYGPQVIGRGLRRANKRRDIREQCHVIDHPIFKHDWLWDMLAADRYQAPLNPGDVIDERNMPKPKPQTELDLDAEEAKKIEEFDWSSLPPIPEPEVFEPITDWRKFLDDFEYDMRGMMIDQRIAQILSRNLDSGMDTLDRSDMPQIDASLLKSEVPAELAELRSRLIKRVRDLARTALLNYDGQADTRQEVLLRVIHEHIARRFTFGQRLREVEDLKLLAQTWHVFDQVKSNFYDARLVASILAKPPREESNGERPGHAFEPA
ncbi:MAG: DEAD/DEAH box helicase family protein [Armatimonadetes bacterium]|nr:DEAD/DEAH box helicase family protein [Armatimonadota bacterium]